MPIGSGPFALSPPRLRPVTRADLPRTHQARHGTVENRLTDSTLVTDAEVAWCMDHAIFPVSEDEIAIQGFTCAKHQTDYICALFVIDQAQGRGHGPSFLDAALNRLKQMATARLS
jgi:hypothetical protein